MGTDNGLADTCNGTPFQKHIVPEIRVFVVVSVILQIFLAIWGRDGQRRSFFLFWWRERRSSCILNFLLPQAYLWADAVAMAALTLASSSNTFIQRKVFKTVNCNGQLLDAVAFWSPFLLLHLGGPDSITALSLEDNTLWWRRFFDFVVYTCSTGFVLSGLFFENEIYIRFCLPIFIVGFLKYLERILSLMSASSRHRRYADFMYPPHGSIHDYRSKFVEPSSNLTPMQKKYYQIISDAHYLFQNFSRAFVDLSFEQKGIHEVSKYLLEHQIKDSKEVFKVIEIELGLMFEELYTKPVSHCAMRRLFVKILSICLIFTVFILYAMATGFYSDLNIVITYVLIGGALVLDMYQGFLLLFNDWVIIELMKQQHKVLLYFPFNILARFLLKAIPSSRFELMEEAPRWSNTIWQCSLLRICFHTPYFKLPEQLESFFKKMGLLWIRDLVGQSLFTCATAVYMTTIEDELKEVILEHLRKRVSIWEEEAVELEEKGISNKEEFFESFLGSWGKLAIKKHNWEECNGFITLEIDHSILVWNIATDICYHQLHEHSDDPFTFTSIPAYIPASISASISASKDLSDYLFYLLFWHPSIVTSKFIPYKLIKEGCNALRKEIDQIITESTESTGRRRIITPVEAFQKLYENNGGNDLSGETIDWNELKTQPYLNIKISVIEAARTLAKRLMRETLDKRWEIIRDMWLEMLVYVANQCPGDRHAAGLSHGGELITHVWLLMAHLGISTLNSL